MMAKRCLRRSAPRATPRARQAMGTSAAKHGVLLGHSGVRRHWLCLLTCTVVFSSPLLGEWPLVCCRLNMRLLRLCRPAARRSFRPLSTLTSPGRATGVTTRGSASRRRAAPHAGTPLLPGNNKWTRRAVPEADGGSTTQRSSPPATACFQGGGAQPPHPCSAPSPGGAQTRRWPRRRAPGHPGGGVGWGVGPGAGLRGFAKLGSLGQARRGRKAPQEGTVARPTTGRSRARLARCPAGKLPCVLGLLHRQLPVAHLHLGDLGLQYLASRLQLCFGAQQRGHVGALKRRRAEFVRRCGRKGCGRGSSLQRGRELHGTTHQDWCTPADGPIAQTTGSGLPIGRHPSWCPWHPQLPLPASPAHQCSRQACGRSRCGNPTHLLIFEQRRICGTPFRAERAGMFAAVQQRRHGTQVRGFSGE